VVDTRLTLATGTAERQAALEMVADRPGNHRITLGADKAYDVAEFVADPREHNVTPHVVRTAGDRTRRRRLNKLSCAGWLPHDRGFVSGLPRSRDEQRSGGPAHNRSGGFPTVVLSPAVRTIEFVCSASSLHRSTALIVSLQSAIG
jgi:hypothetical protein